MKELRDLKDLTRTGLGPSSSVRSVHPLLFIYVDGGLMRALQATPGEILLLLLYYSQA